MPRRGRCRRTSSAGWPTSRFRPGASRCLGAPGGGRIATGRRWRPWPWQLTAGVVGLSAVLAVQTTAKAAVTRALGRERDANLALANSNDELERSRAAVLARYDLAVAAIKAFHTGVSEDFMLKQEKFKDLRDRLLGSASDLYGKLGALLGEETDFASRRALAGANDELAELTLKVGRRDEALAAHRAVLAARRALAAEPGAGPEVGAEVGRSLTRVAGLLFQTGKTEEGLAAYRDAEALLAGPAASSPAARDALANSRSQLGFLLANTGRTADALAAYRLARADLEALVGAPGATDGTRRGWLRSSSRPASCSRTSAGRRRPSRTTALSWTCCGRRPLSRPPPPSCGTSRRTATGAWDCCWTGRAGRGRRKASTAPPWRSGSRWPMPAEGVTEFRVRLGLVAHLPRLPAVPDGPDEGGRRPNTASPPGRCGAGWPRTTPPSSTSAATPGGVAQLPRHAARDDRAGGPRRVGVPALPALQHLPRAGRGPADRHRIPHPPRAEPQQPRHPPERDEQAARGRVGVPRLQLALYRELAAANRTVGAFRSSLEAANHNNLGILLANMDRAGEAEAEYRAALALYRELDGGRADHPGLPEWRAHPPISTSAASLSGTGRPLESGGRALSRALLIQGRWRQAEAAVIGLQTDLAESHAADGSRWPGPAGRRRGRPRSAGPLRSRRRKARRPPPSSGFAATWGGST